MIMEKPRRPICAGVLCFAAVFGGRAGAAEVYPGCPVPPTTFNHIWYIDPVNGKTAAAGGLGTQAAPWNSLQAAFSIQPGYTAPLLSTAPYRHPNDAKTADVFAPGPAAGPIHPGDEILLMSGNYGDVSTSDWNAGLKNPAFVTIAAAPGQTPVLSWLAAVASSYLVFSGIKVEGTADTSPAHARFPMVMVSSSPALPGSNLVFTNMKVSSSDDTSGWTQADWRARRRIVGISAAGGVETTCVSVTNSHISNVEFGVVVAATNMLVSGNEIERFGDDGIDYAANNILITKNYIHDGVDLADGAHPDGMQGYPGKFSNVVIDSNRVIRQTDPNLPFPNFLQGIDAFDGDWTNLTVTNNVVLATSCWGIGFASVHGGKIINNTVLDDLWPRDKWPRAAGKCEPLVSVGAKTHDGSSSNDVVIRNNLTNGLLIYDLGPNMVMDHNICAAIEGGCRILNFLPNGKPNWGAYKPGEYGDHNIVARRGTEGEFVNFDPAKFVFDLRLKAGATAIGAGSPVEAPAVDITGAARGNPVDIGAYRYNAVN
jgi:hypothetical protein